MAMLSVQVHLHMVPELKAGEIEDALNAIRQVGREGNGNEAATSAWTSLSRAEVSDLPTIILGLNGSNALSGNWIRLAVDTIVSREGAKSDISVKELTEIVMDTGNKSITRELAFEILTNVDRDYAMKMSGLFLDDPALGLRRLAVDAEIGRAQILKSVGKEAEAKLRFQTALTKARDIDQVEMVVTELNDLGNDLTVADAFGFIQDWHIIGPFHNNDRNGFAQVFPPEQTVNLSQSYQGKNGEVSWKKFQSKDSYGKVDINEAIGSIKEVTAYAFKTIDVDAPTEVELRLGCKNAWKIWLNGDLVFGRDEYHRGARIDQYAFPVTLKKGVNTLLLKICQNEQTETWTREWEFQFRICDPLGKPHMEFANIEK